MRVTGAGHVWTLLKATPYSIMFRRGVPFASTREERYGKVGGGLHCGSKFFSMALYICTIREHDKSRARSLRVLPRTRNTPVVLGIY